MLRYMIEGWVLWLVVAGLAIGAVTAWLLLVRLPRNEFDVDADERRAEAEWIAATIEARGGVAPRAFVEEVLDLHQAYLSTPRAGAVGPPAAPPMAPPAPDWPEQAAAGPNEAPPRSP
jgi:hypothetical protein